MFRFSGLLVGVCVIFSRVGVHVCISVLGILAIGSPTVWYQFVVILFGLNCNGHGFVIFNWLTVAGVRS